MLGRSVTWYISAVAMKCCLAKLASWLSLPDFLERAGEVSGGLRANTVDIFTLPRTQDSGVEYLTAILLLREFAKPWQHDLWT